MAHPLALRTGPRSRLRSFRQAMNTDGREMMSIRAAIRTSHCHQDRPLTTDTIAAKTPSTALMAMVMTANLLTSNGAAFCAASAPAAGLSVAFSVMVDSVPSPLAFLSAANLFTLSLIQRPAFLYGAQKAWRRLSGFSTMLVTTALQSLPSRS